MIHTGATFNKTLYNLIGQAISTEARAMNNVNQAGLSLYACLPACSQNCTLTLPCSWTPNINIVRDPRWVRLPDHDVRPSTPTPMYRVVVKRHPERTPTPPVSTPLTLCQACKRVGAGRYVCINYDHDGRSGI